MSTQDADYVRVLLAGGPWHDKVTQVPTDAHRWAMPRSVAPQDRFVPEGSDPTAVTVSVDYYAPSCFEGYVPGSAEVLPIWVIEPPRPALTDGLEVGVDPTPVYVSDEFIDRLANTSAIEEPEHNDGEADD